MKLSAYSFALRTQGNDLHGTLFSTLELAGIKDFTPQSPNPKKIIFHCENFYIFCRTEHKPNAMISVKEETLNVEVGSLIDVDVTLSNYRQCGLTKQEAQEYLEKHGKQATGTASRRYRLLNEEQFEEMYMRLFKQSGMKVHESSFKRHPACNFRMSKGDKFFNALEVNVKATIEDLELFRAAWYNGIGRTKTYGFGKLRVETI